jgi:uncharacterized membrane protein YcaP (DUF421 family)
MFLIEVVYRAAFVYLFLLIAMRVMGKRISAMFGIAELAVILMLGAAISSPIQMPTQGVLSALVVLGTVAFLQRLLSWGSYRMRKIELNVHGDVDCLLTNGRLRLDRLDATKISRELLMSELRALGVVELGELRRVYIEAGGALSLIRLRRPLPGLGLAPGRTHDWPVRLLNDQRVCARCGAAPSQGTGKHCTYCGTLHWVRAPVPLDGAPVGATGIDEEP